jgi:hypothetical protein
MQSQESKLKNFHGKSQHAICKNECNEEIRMPQSNYQSSHLNAVTLGFLQFGGFTYPRKKDKGKNENIKKYI